MTAPRRRAASLVLAAVVGLLLAACGSTVSPSPRPSAATLSPSLTPVPGGPSQVAATPAPTLPGQTHTDFGLIWDALPASFPIPAGAIVTDAREAVSGSYALGMPPAAATEAIASGLRGQGWSVDVGTALEDGSVVIDAGGAAEGCVAEVRLTPLSGTVSMSVLYGASCPFD